MNLRERQDFINRWRVLMLWTPMVILLTKDGKLSEELGGAGLDVEQDTRMTLAFDDTVAIRLEAAFKDNATDKFPQLYRHLPTLIASSSMRTAFGMLRRMREHNSRAVVVVSWSRFSAALFLTCAWYLAQHHDPLFVSKDDIALVDPRAVMKQDQKRAPWLFVSYGEHILACSSSYLPPANTTAIILDHAGDAKKDQRLLSALRRTTFVPVASSPETFQSFQLVPHNVGCPLGEWMADPRCSPEFLEERCRHAAKEALEASKGRP